MSKICIENRFYKDQIPRWTCPICNHGVLKLNQDSWFIQETAESVRDRNNEDWDPDWIRYVFSCVFICNNDLCKEPISCCGVGKVEEDQYLDESNRWCRDHNNVFTPSFFKPNLQLMNVSSSCPPDVRTYLQKSFSFYFTDTNASLNSARIAIESILSNLGIKDGNLHQRIIQLPDKYNEIKELLLAAKWLGNSGSHAGDECTYDDVNIAYELLEHVISEIYDNKRERLNEIAKKINEKKGLNR